MTTSPDHPPGLVPVPTTPARATTLPAIVRRGGHPAQPRALGARRPPHHPSRARLRKSPSRRPARSPAKGDLQQTLADYLEAAGLQEAPNDTPLSRTAISKTSQLTDNALHANDISHMMKRRLKDGSLPRRVRPTPSAPPSSPTCSARACRSQATPTRAPPGSITGGTRRSRATSWNGFRS